MSSSNPILRWERIEDGFYRNLEGYILQWDIKDLENYIVTSAPHGGAIALYRDPTKPFEYDSQQLKKRGIFVYSGSGQLIRRIPWENSKIIGMGWSENEHLLLVLENGIARSYYDFDGNFTEFSLGKTAETSGVVDVRFYNSGFVVRLSNDSFVAVTKYDDPNAKLINGLESPESGEGPMNIHGWGLIPPVNSVQDLEIIISVDNSIYSLSEAGTQDKHLQDGSFTLFSTSPDLSMIALFTQKSRLWIISADFQRKIREVQISRQEIPSQLVWCGDSSVAVVYDDEIELYPTGGGSATLWFDSPVKVIQELDGMRTIRNERHDFFTKVPDITVGIFRLGSTAAGAILCDCVEQIDRKSPKADENLTIIGDRLREAVDSCVEAAGYESEASWQKKLLRAALFGKSALVYYNSDKYIRMLEYLRTLNSLRDFKVGMFISYKQLIKFGPLQLIKRILLRNMHVLAFKIAEYLRLPKENIYVHWACAKIRSSQDDDATTFDIIIKRLREIPDIAYEEIAKVSFEEGRSELAISFINCEPRPYKQIPLLLAMGEDSLALSHAEQSADVNILYYVLLTLRQKLSLAAFFRLVNNVPIAAKCFEVLCKAEGERDIELLNSFYYQDDRQLESVQLKYQLALKNQKDSLEEMITTLSEVQHVYGNIPGKVFETKMIAEQSKLLQLQQQLERDYDQPYIGLSVSATISSLLTAGQKPRAQKVKDEFKVPDKRFWWIKLQSLVSRREWEGLEKFATSKKSPIGYKPFYEECMKAGNQTVAAKFISLCTEVAANQQIEMCIESNDIKQAVGIATKSKNVEALQNLQSLATPSIQRDIDQALDVLLKRK